MSDMAFIDVTGYYCTSGKPVCSYYVLFSSGERTRLDEAMLRPVDLERLRSPREEPQS